MATAKINMCKDFRRQISMQIVIPSWAILKFFLQIFEVILVYLVQLWIPCGTRRSVRSYNHAFKI